jgi:hypothetical protein
MADKKDELQIPSSFDLKDLMNLQQNPQIQRQLQGLMGQQMENHKNEEKKEENLSREELRKRLRAKIRNGEEMRAGKSFQEKKQVEQLKSNPMIQRMGKNIDMDMLIEQVMKQNGLPDHPKQRKAVKKQLESMMGKMDFS